MALKICIIFMDDVYDYMLKEFTGAFKKLDVSIDYIQYSHSGLLKYIHKGAFDAIIISGSCKRILEKGAPTLPKVILKLNIPILGLCYGFEWIVKTLGGKIGTFENDKYHTYNKLIELKSPPFAFSVPKKLYKFNHSDYIAKLPNGLLEEVYVYGDQIWVAQNKELKIIGLQFHPEKLAASGDAFYRAWINWLKEK